MSDEVQSTQPEIRIDPNAELTPENQLILLNQWKQKVEQELVGYAAGKDVILQAFKKQKDRFDKILSVKVKKMKKYDAVMSARKKVLAEIVVEIDTLSAPKI